MVYIKITTKKLFLKKFFMKKLKNIKQMLINGLIELVNLMNFLNTSLLKILLKRLLKKDNKNCKMRLIKFFKKRLLNYKNKKIFLLQIWEIDLFLNKNIFKMKLILKSNRWDHKCFKYRQNFNQLNKHFKENKMKKHFFKLCVIKKN